MIIVTRINGPVFSVNPDLLLRVDSTPDTILTFIDGTKLIVRESMDQVNYLIHTNRAQLLAAAQDIQFEAANAAVAASPEGHIAPVTPIQRGTY